MTVKGKGKARKGGAGPSGQERRGGDETGSESAPGVVQDNWKVNGAPSTVIFNLGLRPRSQVSQCLCHRVFGCAARPWPWPPPALTTLSPNLQKEKRNEALIKDILEDLDTSGDNDLSFEEFITLVGRLTEASHEEMHKNTPKGHGHTHGPGFGGSGRNPCKTQGGNQGGGHGHTHDHGHGHGHSHGDHSHSH